MFLALFALFLKYYFLNTYINYVKGSTTFSTKSEEITKMDQFYIVLCIKDPRFKPSITKQFSSIQSGFRYDDNLLYKIPRKGSIWQVIEHITYQVDKDYNIKIQLENWEENSNISGGLDFESIATYRNGMCTLIKPNVSLPSNYGRYQIQVKFSPNLKDEDLPKTVKMAFTSASGWHGFVLDDWPDFKPNVYDIQIKKNNTSFWFFKLAQTDFLFTKGSEDFNTCFMDHLAKNVGNCEEICYPIVFNFLPNVSACNTVKDFLCISNLTVDSRQKRYECLHQKKQVQINADETENGIVQNNQTGFAMQIYSSKSTKVVQEEILVITTEEFIGSVGGSLGLFVGFSFFTYLSDFLEFLFNRTIKINNSSE